MRYCSEAVEKTLSGFSFIFAVNFREDPVYGSGARSCWKAALSQATIVGYWLK